MAGAELLNTTGQCSIADAVQGRGARDDAHTDRHAVAVPELKVLAGFDGVSGAVSKVEELALVGFALVGDDHGALDVDIAGDDERYAGYILVEQLQRERGLLQLGKKLGVGDHGVLHNLAAAVGELLGRESGQTSHVGDNYARLPKGAGQVFAGSQVDGGLAAHRRIHHGEQTRGDLHKLAAAHVGGGHKARHVAHDAAAECHYHVGARKLVLGHKLQNGNIGFCALMGLAGLEGADAHLVA